MSDLDWLDYALPPERIAQEPVRPRDAARLLVVERDGPGLEERAFRELPDLVGPRDLLVVNDTRVLPARLRGVKATGGRAEALLIERLDPRTWRALVRASGRLRPGLELRFHGGGRSVGARVARVEAEGECALTFDADLDPLLDSVGEAPLPPYIHRDRPRKQDRDDYQTVFAREPGAVAAPTASLHFTPELAARLPIATLTLHIGPGTFRPIRGGIEDHALEAERYCIPAATAEAIARTRAGGGRVVAVGTTVVRALEAAGGAAGRGATDLFIRPGHRFTVVDSLLTNFHLPRSTLLALVMAFAGVERVRRAYAHALERGFRFYSYGDAMWVR